MQEILSVAVCIIHVTNGTFFEQKKLGFAVMVRMVGKVSVRVSCRNSKRVGHWF